MPIRFPIAAPVALAAGLAIASPAVATENAVAPDLITKPLGMLIDEAAQRGGAVVPPSDASPVEVALGLFQRGFYADARTAALEAIEAGEGAGAAMMLLSTMSEAGLGTARDGDEALSWLDKAAKAGNAEARHALAVRQLTGEGVAPDRDGALATLRELADSRPEAAFDLAQLLLSEGDDEGERFLGIAADAGVPEAQYALGGLLMARGSQNGSNEGADALEWMVRAARGGLAEAQMELGLWLAEGRGAKADPAAAHDWIERAALSGLPLARNRLAHMYRVGIGVPADPVLAARWHALARFDGVADGDLDALVATLGPEARRRAFRGLPTAAVAAVSTSPAPEAALPSADERPAEGLPGVRLGAE